MRRAILGDNAINRRFLHVVLESCGFNEIVDADSAEELIKACATPADVVVFDPGIRNWSSHDVVAELLQLVPRSRLVLLSARTTELTRARDAGIVTAEKRSILQLDGIRRAVLTAVSQRTPAVIVDLTKAEAEPEASRQSTFDGDLSVGRHHLEPLVASPSEPTWDRMFQPSSHVIENGLEPQPL